MVNRDTSRDPKGAKQLLTKFKWLWTLIQAIPWLRRRMNYLLLNSAIKPIPDRPEPLCNKYTSC